MLMGVALPIMVQNGITNFVSLLDNLMVGGLGTETVSAVAIVNQIMFVYFLCIFGGLSGAGIFTAQFYGKGDEEGIKNTIRFKMMLGVLLVLISAAIMWFWGADIISLFLHESEDGGDLALTLSLGLDYLHIIILTLPLVMLTNTYAGTLRECGQTVVPMNAGLISVAVNLTFNYLLIFGKFGFPEMGVNGAAIATLIARGVEFAVIRIWVIVNIEKVTYFKGVYKTLKVPLNQLKKFITTGLPLLVNETFWSLGIFLLGQAYSLRGLNVVAGQSISNNINNVFNIAFLATGDAVAIIVGRYLGAGDMKKAREVDNKIIATSLMLALAVGAFLLATSWFYPTLYDVSDEAKRLGMMFIIVQALFYPKEAFLHSSYFTIRAGGKTLVTFLFDSVFMMVISVPAAFVLTRFTSLNVILIFTIIHCLDFIKCAIGYVILRKGYWMQNIVSKI
ncbi:MAG: MATE family efflux transporter [Saccharofermentans sp.]|nr:MATE family efflux transporter [Saccharofermentans sp.]